MVKKKSSFLLIISLCLTLFGCVQANVEYQDIEETKWQSDERITFQTITSPQQLYIRHTNDYPFQNIWLKMSYRPKDSLPKFNRYEFQMARPDGSWLGEKKAALYNVGFKLDSLYCPTDTCTLIIEQNMRANPLEGIQSIGIGE